MNFVFFNMMVTGYAGQHRRIYNPSEYEFLKHLTSLNEHITIFAFLLGVFQLLFLFNIIFTILKSKKCEKNPWNATTLEWTVEYPIPHGNFISAPTIYNGPHEYSNPKVFNKDWLGQNENFEELL